MQNTAIPWRKVQKSWRLHADTIYLDLGSGVTKIRVGSQPLRSEATCFALHIKSQTIIAWGNKAQKLRDRTPPGIQLFWPIKHGVASDQTQLEHYLGCVWNEVTDTHLLKPSVWLSIPNQISPEEQKILREACRNSGAGKTTLVQISEALAVSQASKGQLRTELQVIVGADLTQVSVIEANKILISRTKKHGLNDMTRVIQQWMQSEHSCEVGWATAQVIQQKMVALVRKNTSRLYPVLTVRGKHAINQVPTSVTLNQDVAAEYVSDWHEQIISVVDAVLSDVPTQLYPVIHRSKIIFFGGGVHILGLAEIIEGISGLKVDVQRDSGMVLNGLEKIATQGRSRAESVF